MFRTARLRFCSRTWHVLIPSSLGNVPDVWRMPRWLTPKVLIPSSLGNVPDLQVTRLFFLTLIVLIPSSLGNVPDVLPQLMSLLQGESLNPIKSGKCSGPRYDALEEAASRLNPIKSGKCSGQNGVVTSLKNTGVLIPSSLGNVPDPANRRAGGSAGPS